MNELTISGLAKAAGVGVETVRYYQRRGLLREPLRGYGSVRRYGSDDVGRLRFIRAAQDLGFTLQEIAELLSLQTGASCKAVEKLAQSKLDVIRRRVEGLNRMARTLEVLIGQCEAMRGRVSCPIIDSLHKHA